MVLTSRLLLDCISCQVNSKCYSVIEWTDFVNIFYEWCPVWDRFKLREQGWMVSPCYHHSEFGISTMKANERTWDIRIKNWNSERVHRFYFQTIFGQPLSPVHWWIQNVLSICRNRMSYKLCNGPATGFCPFVPQVKTFRICHILQINWMTKSQVFLQLQSIMWLRLKVCVISLLLAGTNGDNTAINKSNK